MRIVFELLFAFLAILLLRLLYQLYKRIFKYSGRTIDDVAPLLREVKLDQLEELVDQQQEDLLRLNLSAKQFRQNQKKRVRRMLEYVACMTHNTGIVWEWARYERKRGWIAGDTDHQQLSDEVIHTCIQVVGGARAIQLQLHLWLIKNAILPRMPELSLASLRKIETFDLLESYDHLRGAALALSQMIYGDTYFDQLLQAL